MASCIWQSISLTYFWTTFFVRINQHDCMTLRQPGLAVFPVDSCPRILSEVETATLRLNCSDIKEFRNVYHCLPSSNLSLLVEFCYNRTSGLTGKGNCLVLSNEYINVRQCNQFTSGCPSVPYYYKEIFNYPACVQVNKQNRCYLADPKCPNISFVEETTKPTVNVMENNTVLMIEPSAVVIGALVPFLLIGLVILIMWKRHQSCRRGKKGIEDTAEDAEKSPLMTGGYNETNKNTAEDAEKSPLMTGGYNETNKRKDPEENLEEKELLSKIKKYLDSGKKTTIRHARGVIVGCAGAGKTSLLQRLLEKDLKNIKSTFGMKVHHQVFDVKDGSLIGTDREIKSLINIPKQKADTKNVIDKDSNSVNSEEKQGNAEKKSLAQNELEEDLKDAKSTVESEVHQQTPDKEEGSLIGADATENKSLLSIAKEKQEDTNSGVAYNDSNTENLEGLHVEDRQNPQDNFECQNLEKKNHDQVAIPDHSIAENISKERLLTILEKIENHTTLSITDFAGQFSYYVCHQIYMRPKTFFVLVLSLSQKFEDFVCKRETSEEDSFESKTNVISKWKYQDYLEFWLNSIKTFGSTEASVFLAFTHRDEVSEEQKKKFSRCFWDTVLKKEDWFMKCVDNRKYYVDLLKLPKPTTELLEKMRKEMVEVVNDGINTIEKNEVPSSWALLEQLLKEDGREILTIDEIMEINRSLPMEYRLKDEEEIRAFLSLFHHHGFLLYFEEDGLNNYVILDVQWFATAFSILIADEKHINEYCDVEYYELWKKYNDTGDLTNRLIEVLWKDTNYLDHKNALVTYMDRLKMLVKIGEIELNDHSKDKIACYIPCMNKTIFHPNEIPEDNMEKSSILCFRFSSFTLFEYYRLVAHCMSSLKWEPRKKYETAAEFEAENHTVLVGIQKNEIQLQLMRLKSLSLKKEISSKIGREIEKALTDLGKTFKKNGMIFERGYKCQRVFCDETDKTFTKAPTSSTTDEEIQCSCKREKRHRITICYWEQLVFASKGECSENQKGI